MSLSTERPSTRESPILVAQSRYLQCSTMVSGGEVTEPGLTPNENVAGFTVDHDFSQHGEQQIIVDFFSRPPQDFNRYCVDAGAYDGVVGSNLRALFLNAWRGVAIEPNPRTFARLRKLYTERLDVICGQQALSDSRSANVPMKFLVGPAGTAEEDKWKYGQVSSLHNSLAGFVRVRTPVGV